jgi:arylsulfatase A-like enzyme/Tfp pilus assembly protein PilF
VARRPFRYTLILASVTLGAALAAAGGWRYARTSAPLGGPIIFISIDSLRADHLPAYGYTHARTPAIDALAADGVVFDRAYSHVPLTLPAHAALLSGQLPFETGVRDDVGATVPPGTRLLPQMLRERGYTTGAVVSTSLLRKGTGVGQGFDFFDDEVPDAPGEMRAGPARRDGTASEQVAEHWLDGVGTARAFLFLHLDEPRRPFAPPDRFSEDAPYDGAIEYADEIVGRLVRYLKDHQLYTRATIVLLADHGEGLGDHGEQQHGLLIYDEAIHVPLIVKQEGNAGAGRRVGDVVQHIDVVPTILDLVKAPVPGALRGRSLKPVLEDTGHLEPQSVYAESVYGRYHFGWSALTGATGARYQYIKAPREEIYDLTRDPRERTNLASELAEARLALSADVTRITGGVAQAPPTGAPAPTMADPKEVAGVLETYRRATERLGEGKWAEALGLFQTVLRDVPGASEIWAQVADIGSLLNRQDIALDAYQHITTLNPSSPAGDLGAADVLFRARRFDDARTRAMAALDAAPDNDLRSRASAHELLARIALARRDADTAHEEATLAQQADPLRPVGPFVDARVLYDQGKYEEALPLFEQAIAEGAKAGSAPVSELHFYAGDTLEHLDRQPEAAPHFEEEIRHFPRNVRARASLASLYQATGQAEAADTAVSDLLRAVPTAESYALAVKLWKSFGKAHQAEATRLEARRLFANARR